MNANNNGAQQYTECLPAAADQDPTVAVTPVCRHLYIGEVVHYFVEAAGVTKQNATVNINREPMELIIEAVVQREHRVNREYKARIRMDSHDYLLENASWDASDGEIHAWFPFISS